MNLYGICPTWWPQNILIDVFRMINCLTASVSKTKSKKEDPPPPLWLPRPIQLGYELLFFASTDILSEKNHLRTQFCWMFQWGHLQKFDLSCNSRVCREIYLCIRAVLDGMPFDLAWSISAIFTINTKRKHLLDKVLLLVIRVGHVQQAKHVSTTVVKHQQELAEDLKTACSKLGYEGNSLLMIDITGRLYYYSWHSILSRRSLRVCNS